MTTLIATAIVLLIGYLTIKFFQNARFLSKSSGIIHSDFWKISKKINASPTTTELWFQDDEIEMYYQKHCQRGHFEALSLWRQLHKEFNDRYIRLRASGKGFDLRKGIAILIIAATLFASCTSTRYWAGGPCPYNKNFVGYNSK